MKATALEFKFRLWISVAIFVLGFWAPWIDWLEWGSRSPHLWGWLAIRIGSLGVGSANGFVLVSILAIAAAALGAGLRIWSTAYLGTRTVFNAEMKAGPGPEAGPEPNAGQVLADGPYRFLRNPLYLGSFLNIVAISILMPPSGAAVALLLLAAFLLRLILGEEAFLRPRLGEPYAAYLKAVPRLWPSLRPRVLKGGRSPLWGRAMLGEIFPFGTFLSFAALSWQYNSDLLTQAVLVSFGVSLVVRAFVVPKAESSSSGA